VGSMGSLCTSWLRAGEGGGGPSEAAAP